MIVPKIIKRTVPAILISAVILFGISNNSLAQSAQIRGLVTDQSTGQSLGQTTIALLDKSTRQIVLSTATDNNGFYSLSRVPEGSFLLVARFVGFETWQKEIEIGSNSGVIALSISLVPISEELETVVISADRQRDASPGQIKIIPENLRRSPTPAASADLVNYIQSLPGVVATGDRGGQLFVRGGTSSENLVLMDGLQVFQPFHIVGFFSIFPEDVLSSVDFYAGGFGARYSGSTSSVLDVKLKNAHLFERKWSASVSPFVSDFHFETPITKGSSSLMASFRGSLIEHTSPHFLNETQPLTFNSQLIKYSMLSGTGFGCSAQFLRTYDRGQLDYDLGDYFKWQNIVAGGRCAGVQDESNVAFMDINFGVTYFNNESGNAETGIGTRNSNTFRSHVNVNLTSYIGNIRLDYGANTSYRTIDYTIGDLFVSIQENKEVFIDAGAYISAHINLWDRILIDPGLSYTSFLGQFDNSWEPRFQLSWLPRGRGDERLSFAAGIYRQGLVGISDYRDAGSAFTAWMFPPESDRYMESRQVLLGWRQPITSWLYVSAEGYYKWIEDVPVSTWSTIAQFSTDLSYADGTIEGIDVKLELDYKRFYLHGGYGYSKTTYSTSQALFDNWFGESVQSYHPAHDRRHQLTLQSGFDWRKFSISASWMVGSGLPFTRPMGFDSYISFYERPPDVNESYGTPRVLLEKPFRGRMPDFHRLDVSISREIQFQKVNLVIQGGAINAYDWQNLFYYDVYNQRGIRQLPLIPYVSLKVSSR